MEPFDSDLMKWVHELLDLAVNCFSDGDHTPMILLFGGGKRNMINLTSTSGDITEGLIESGRHLIRQWAQTGDVYVMVWDGYLTTDGQRRDAAFAEAGARGEDKGYLFAQRYKPGKTKARKLGKPILVTERVHLWAPVAK